MATATTVSGIDSRLMSTLLAQNAQTANLHLDTSAASTPVTTTTSTTADSVTSSTSGFLTDNQNYRVKLLQKGGKTVIGNAPQDFELQLQNNYDNLLTQLSNMSGALPSSASGLSGLAKAVETGANVVATGAVALGYGQAVAATAQVWTGTSPLEFTLPISFRAYDNPSKDVIEPLRDLIAMASPEGVAAWLKSPGPTMLEMLEAAKNSITNGSSFLTGLNNAITMYFGKNIVVPGLVITGLNVKIYNRAERKTGLPIAAEATVSLRTVVAYSKQNVLAMFYGNAYGDTTFSTDTSAAGAASGG
jgi:hypothetical protein